MKRGVLLIIAGIAVVLVIAFTIYALVNRQPQVAQDKTLTVYMPFDEVEVYEKISADFASANPSAELVFKYIEAKDAKEYEAKVVNEIADGTGPDIWLVRSDWIPKHAAKSVAFTATADQPDPIASAKTALEPAVVDLNVYQGKLYGIPLFADTLAVIYNQDYYNNVGESLSEDNKKLLSTFPGTWDLVKRQTEITSQSINNVIAKSSFALGTVETMYAPIDVFSAILLQYGGGILSEDESSVVFNLAQFKDGESVFPATSALSLFTSFSKPSEPNYSWNNDLGDAVEAFKAQKTGAIIGYRSLYKELLEGDYGFKIVVTPLPQLSDDENKRVDFGLSWSHIISNQTEKVGLAKAYMSYLTIQEVLIEYAVTTDKLSSLPSKQVVPKETKGGISAVTNLYRSQFSTLKQLPKTNWLEVDQRLQDLIKLVTNSNQLPQSSVDSIAQEMKELIK